MFQQKIEANKQKINKIKRTVQLTGLNHKQITITDRSLSTTPIAHQSF